MPATGPAFTFTTVDMTVTRVTCREGSDPAEEARRVTEWIAGQMGAEPPEDIAVWG